MIQNEFYGLFMSYKNPVQNVNLKQYKAFTKTNITRRVLWETKAIMSSPVCHWMESFFL